MEAAKYILEKMGEAHRGAYQWSENEVALFENRRAPNFVRNIVTRCGVEGIPVLARTSNPDRVVLVMSDDAELLNDMVWDEFMKELNPDHKQPTGRVRKGIQRDIADSVIALRSGCSMKEIWLSKVDDKTRKRIVDIIAMRDPWGLTGETVGFHNGSRPELVGDRIFHVAWPILSSRGFWMSQVAPYYVTEDIIGKPLFPVGYSPFEIIGPHEDGHPEVALARYLA